MREAKRFLGLELTGAKNQKTALSVLEYYPKEQKIFLLDIFDRVIQEEEQSADEALMSLIRECGPPHAIEKIGVNVSLQFPPCTLCTKRQCERGGCTGSDVKWMREYTRKVERGHDRGLRVLEFTPYTQRPIELWIRYEVLASLPPALRFEIEEALGSNRAPLTARMAWIKKQLPEYQETWVEVWPKLTLARLAMNYKLPKNWVTQYRHLEKGVEAREEILESFVEEGGIFIYQRDIHKLASSLGAFDSFIVALTALLFQQGRCTKVPKGFPKDSGWVAYPELDPSL